MFFLLLGQIYIQNDLESSFKWHNLCWRGDPWPEAPICLPTPQLLYVPVSGLWGPQVQALPTALETSPQLLPGLRWGDVERG